MNRQGIWLGVAAFLLLSVSTISAQGQKKPPKPKRKIHRLKKYGQLKARDFRGRPPEGKSILSSLDAVSYTQLVYTYDYKAFLRNGRWTIRVTKLKATAMFDRAKSWNQLPKNLRLLRHEQGHFDLTQAHALKSAVENTRKIKRRPIVTYGRSKSAALKRAKLRVDILVKPYLDVLPKLHKEYDRITAHGTKAQEQLQAQREHATQLRDYSKGGKKTR